MEAVKPTGNSKRNLIHNFLNGQEKKLLNLKVVIALSTEESVSQLFYFLASQPTVRGILNNPKTAAANQIYTGLSNALTGFLVEGQLFGLTVKFKFKNSLRHRQWKQKGSRQKQANGQKHSEQSKDGCRTAPKRWQMNLRESMD